MNRTERLMRIYLRLVLVAFFLSAMGQSFGKRRLVSNQIWPYAPGWQQEISLWNGFAILLVRPLVDTGNVKELEICIRAIVPFITSLGINHAVSAYQEPSTPAWHRAITGMHFTGALAGAILLYRSKQESNQRNSDNSDL